MEEKERILAEFHASGMNIRRACSMIPGFPARRTLGEWVRQERAGLLDPPALPVKGSAKDRPRHRRYEDKTKREAVRLLSQGMRPTEVARRLDVSSGELVSAWAKKARGANILPSDEPVGRCAGMAKRTAGAEPEQTVWRDWAADLPEDPEERLAAMERKYIEMGAVLDVLKAPGPGSLSNLEKRAAGQVARERGARLADVCSDLAIAKSTYEAQPAIAAKADKYAALRRRIRKSFEASGRRYGSESVWADLRRGEGPAVKAADLGPDDDGTPVIVSEKVVRRIMREERLVPVTATPRKRYSSYEGELEERPENLPLNGDGTHDFHAGEPFELVVSDVTEFSLPRFKCYLSPAIDCYDGDPIAWTISRHPDAELCSTMLEAAAEKAGHGFVCHTDGGGCYMGRRWKGVCAERGITRSMSRKGTSPDNARAEGFFGTLKRDFFDCRDWRSVTYERFAKELDDYIMWYRDCKIKKSLGWKTIREHREGQGIAV